MAVRIEQIVIKYLLTYTVEIMAKTKEIIIILNIKLYVVVLSILILHYNMYYLIHFTLQETC
jgi:hypothetical protein